MGFSERLRLTLSQIHRESQVLNGYSYVGNRPTTRIDRNGEVGAVTLGLGLVGAFTGLSYEAARQWAAGESPDYDAILQAGATVGVIGVILGATVETAGILTGQVFIGLEGLGVTLNGSQILTLGNILGSTFGFVEGVKAGQAQTRELTLELGEPESPAGNPPAPFNSDNVDVPDAGAAGELEEEVPDVVPVL